MKIYNNSEEFELTFDGRDIIVPEGLSEDFEEKVANHIKFVAENWGNDVEMVTSAEEEKAVLANKGKVVEEEKEKVVEELTKEVGEKAKPSKK